MIVDFESRSYLRRIAALWETRDLLIQLHWVVRGTTSYAAERRAPSWSWASCRMARTMEGAFMALRDE
jgi:hypothetical protein